MYFSANESRGNESRGGAMSYVDLPHGTVHYQDSAIGGSGVGMPIVFLHGDLTPAGLGRLVADFLDSLELSDVILVGNDSGVAVAQVVAARHAERLGALV